MSNEVPLLTLAQVREWESRAAYITQAIESQQIELSMLNRRIAAAKNLMETLPPDAAWNAPELEATGEVEPTTQSSSSEESISNVILAAVGAVKAPAKAPSIKKWLETNNPAVNAKIDANPAYLYTTLTRHVRAGRLARRGKTYRVVPHSPVPGESGSRGIEPLDPETADQV